MQLISVRELIYLLKKAGWQKMAQKGSHAQYRHPVRKGKITIPSHRLGNTNSSYHRAENFKASWTINVTIN